MKTDHTRRITSSLIGLSVSLACHSVLAAPTKVHKDVLLENAPRVVSTVAPVQTGGQTASILPDTAMATALADMGLFMLRQQSLEQGNSQSNTAVSPLSLASAAALVHAGTADATARELATLLDSAPAGDARMTIRLPSVIKRLSSKAVVKGIASPLVMANRVWLDQGVAQSVSPVYASMVTERLNADAALIAFGKPEDARRTINQWTASQTAGHIPALLPPGSIRANNRFVVTNAIHFKGAWSVPFNPKMTTDRPFNLGKGQSLAVPTMEDDRPVLQAVVDNIQVMELPFVGGEYSMRIGIPPEGHSLDALEKDLTGTDIAGWGDHLKSETCRLQLPKFSIAPKSRSLKNALQSIGIATVFTPAADFSPMIGKSANGVHLDDIFHSASIVVDEQGAEAAAATAAVATSKSFQIPPKVCGVNRPFVFSIIHKPTGTPVFFGKVANPGQQ